MYLRNEELQMILKALRTYPVDGKRSEEVLDRLRGKLRQLLKLRELTCQTRTRR